MLFFDFLIFYHTTIFIYYSKLSALHRPITMAGVLSPWGNHQKCIKINFTTFEILFKVERIFAMDISRAVVGIPKTTPVCGEVWYIVYTQEE